MRSVLALALAGVLAPGCAGGTNGAANASCEAYPACPNDAPSSKQQCQSELSDPGCGPQFQTYLNCAAQNHSCDSAGHVQIAPACDNAAAPWVACMTANLDSGLRTE